MALANSEVGQNTTVLVMPEKSTVEHAGAVEPEGAAHVEILHRTHTEMDVLNATQENPYRELNFIGTYAAALFSCCGAFTGFLMPVTSLTLIEAVLPKSSNGIWIPLAWILSSAISFILLGRLSDIFGRRYFFSGCAIFALIGSIIGATAGYVNTLIAASVFLGLGASGQLSFIISVGELVPIRHRFAMNGLIFFSVVC